MTTQRPVGYLPSAAGQWSNRAGRWCTLLATLGAVSTPAQPGTTPLFERLDPSRSGVDFVQRTDTGHPLKRLYVGAFGCGGVACGDFDGDGRVDLFFADGAGDNRLYFQRDGLRFEEAAAAAGVTDPGHWGAGTAMLDIEGDGDLDLYVCNYESPNRLFLNDGDGRFTEEAARFALDRSGAFLMATFADYDRDGDLDAFLLGHRHYREGGRPASSVTVVKAGTPTIRSEFARYYNVTLREGKRWEVNNTGAPDLLLRNDGGRFVDATQHAGIAPATWQGNAAMWFDYNNDGWTDLYVANDFEDPDQLYRNNGNGTFTDVTRETLAHVTWFSMGSDAADINNDGLLDFISLDMAGTSHYKSKTTMGGMGANRYFMETADPAQYMRNCLQLGTGTGRFIETAFQAGVAKSDWSWAAKFGDMDNDGLIDLFVSNGMTRNFNDSDHPLDVDALVGATEWDQYENRPPRPETNQAFRNLGGDLGRFENLAASWGLDHEGMSYSAAWCDLESDGDLDLVVANLEEPPGVFINRGAGGHWLVLELRGPPGNRHGFGARVQLETAAGLQLRDFHPMRGFSSTDEPVVHFGLGSAETVSRIAITWPDGSRQTLADVAAGQRLEVMWEPDLPVAPPPPAPEAPLFATGDDVIRGARHWEEPFPDFKHQPLLPNALSRFGPGIACGDTDGDGVDEVFTGGGTGQLGNLLKRDAAGRWNAIPFTAAEEDRTSEDLGAVFFDADGDGDLDLYVVSGSVEAPPGHAVYQDRLYLNGGAGAFVRSPDAVPAEGDSGSVAAVADFDRDGDLDIFAGGRVVPGAYPETPRSHLWRNRGDGTFEEAADTALSATGLVTSALWSDVDDDGWVDLLVTREWAPPALFRNRRGELVDSTLAAGLAELSGWWNGIAGADFDRDGDIDYVLTNAGLNTKYHASPDHPELLFYGDMDGSGRNNIVEAGFEHDTLFPHRGFSCSTSAMPNLTKRVTNYHEFGLATFGELYPTSRVAGATRFVANVLESGVLWNDGSGKFHFDPLPALAQVSTSFGCLAGDFDGDANPDLILAQNFFDTQIETRPVDTGLGAYLQGDGRGGFTALRPDRSGVVLPGNSRALVSADLDGDGGQDLLVTQSDDSPVALLSQPHAVTDAGSSLAVRVTGNSAGARVRFEQDGANPQVAEIYAGGGYLSQSSPVVHFGDAGAGGEVVVRRAGGTETRHPVAPGTTSLAVGD